MFKLLRLAIYAVVGYTVYQFVTDVINADAQASSGRSRGGSGARGGRQRSTGGQQMTGARRGGGRGKTEQTQDSDGGGTRHRVGRGVV
jgi:hypothetical protein